MYVFPFQRWSGKSVQTPPDLTCMSQTCACLTSAISWATRTKVTPNIVGPAPRQATFIPMVSRQCNNNYSLFLFIDILMTKQNTWLLPEVISLISTIKPVRFPLNQKLYTRYWLTQHLKFELETSGSKSQKFILVI